MSADGTDLSVQVDRSGPFPLVRLAGDVDIESSGELTDVLKALLASSGDRPLVLDLTEVEFMDSSGLGVLVGAHKEATAQGGSLILVSPHPRVAKILRITKLHKVFTIHDTLAGAMPTQPDGAHGTPQVSRAHGTDEGDGDRETAEDDAAPDTTAGDEVRDTTTDDGAREAARGDAARDTAADEARKATGGDGARDAAANDRARDTAANDGARDATRGLDGIRGTVGGEEVREAAETGD